MLSQFGIAVAEHPPSSAPSFTTYKGRAWPLGHQPCRWKPGLSPAHGPAGHPWHATLYLHNLAHVFSFEVQGFRAWVGGGGGGVSPFFLKKKVSAIPWRDTQKAREVGRQSSTLLTEQAGLNSLWDNPPCTARSEQGFWMTSLLFLNQTHSSSCVPNTLVFSCWSLTLGRMR